MSEPIRMGGKKEEPQSQKQGSTEGATTTETRVEIGFFARKVTTTSTTPPEHDTGPDQKP
jgi:hypothetical protein